MNIKKRITHDANHRSNKHVHLLAGLVVVLLSYSGLSWAVNDVAGKYQNNLLFNPSKSILAAEARGRVTIYDSLEHSVVDHVLNTQFDRIENMMFVRTRQTLADGSVVVDEDC